MGGDSRYHSYKGQMYLPIRDKQEILVIGISLGQQSEYISGDFFERFIM